MRKSYKTFKKKATSLGAIKFKLGKYWFLFFIVVVTLFFFVRYKLVNQDFWWRFPTGGEIYSDLMFDESSIYFGNNASTIYAVDQITGKEKWRYETLQNPIIWSPILTGKTVIFTTEGGVLYALNKATGEEVWRLPNPKGVRFSAAPQESGGRVFVGDANGVLYAINPKTGKITWSFETGQVERLSQILVDAYLNWFGIFKIEKGLVYLGSRDGTLYVINAKNGNLKWRYDTGSAITTEAVIYHNQVLVGNKDGTVTVLHKRDGRELTKWNLVDSSISCIKVIEGSLLNPQPVVISVYQNGDLHARKKGEEVWSQKTGSPEVRCPLYFDNAIFLVSADGKVRSVNPQNGNENWVAGGFGSLQYLPKAYEKLVNIDILAGDVLFNTPILYFGDKNGKVSALNAKSGEIIWEFKAFSKINGTPKVWGRFLYFQSSDGGVYRVRKLDGRIDFPLGQRVKPQVKVDLTKLAGGEIYEITVIANEALLTNPFRELRLFGEFTDGSGKKIPVNGFYYDKDTWKVRFRPPSSGEWYWNLTVSYPDRTFKKQGDFIATKVNSKKRIFVDVKNPKRLTHDGQTIFNAVGLQNSMLDNNYNGNPFDDWAIGEGEPLFPQSSSGNFYFGSDEIINLDEYLETYGGSAGFNLYRWGLGNSSFRLWSDYSVRGQYFTQWGKWGDELATKLEENGFRIWLTLFNFEIPYSQTMRPVEYDLLNNYVDYIVARYGAYVDIWEVGNEVYAPNWVIDYIAKRINEKDYLDRPISTSWEKPEIESIDIISPHWYESEILNDSDMSVVRKVAKYKDNPKPVIFGEQGNQKVNWDETSAVRMRVRSWAAFFNEAILIFWNSSDRKDYHNAVLNNANIYIGETERGYIKVLQDFTKGVDLQAKKFTFETGNSSVRSYGLRSSKEVLGYFFHYKNPGRETAFVLKIGLDKPGVVTWLDPVSGKELGKVRVTSGAKNIASPVFTQDLAVKITFD